MELTAGVGVMFDQVFDRLDCVQVEADRQAVAVRRAMLDKQEGKRLLL